MINLLPSELEKAERLEDSTLKAAKNFLKSDLQLVERLAQLYLMIQSHYDGRADLSPQQMVFLQSAISCRHQLILGMLTLLRGHLADCSSYVRKSQEYTIFAARVLEKPDSALSWLQAASDEKAWKEYMSRFKIHNMVSPNKRGEAWKTLSSELGRLNPLFDAYALVSRRLHASVLAAGPFAKEVGGRVELFFYDGYVDHDILSKPELVKNPFYFMLSRHLDIIHVQAMVLLRLSGIQFDEAAWATAFQQAEKLVSENS